MYVEAPESGNQRHQMVQCFLSDESIGLDFKAPDNQGNHNGGVMSISRVFFFDGKRAWLVIVPDTSLTLTFVMMSIHSLGAFRVPLLSARGVS